MPMYSFFDKDFAVFQLGNGMSVLYWRTSVPPFFSISTPFIVLGSDVAIFLNVKPDVI